MMHEEGDRKRPSLTLGSGDLTRLGAVEIAQGVANGDFSASEVVEAFIERIGRVNDELNAVVVPLFDDARAEAKSADEARRRGEPLGPLHGVPVTIKECYYLAGAPATMGLSHCRPDPGDGVLVKRLRRAGAIVLGKTNVPQLMIWHETDNPVYGRTNNPWSLDRSPGGSTGGEAAILAAAGSALGLGNDLGGSIRLPSHFCGVHGFKPTSRRLPRTGALTTLRGMEAILVQPGPMARRVEDLGLAMQVLADPGDEPVPGDVAPGPLPDPARAPIEGLRVAMWTDNGYFPACPAIRRAVEEAADALRGCGAIVEPFQPPEIAEAMELYLGILAADGGADARRLLKGSRVDWRVKRLLQIAGFPNLLRPAAAGLLRLGGQRWAAEVLSCARSTSADGYWRLTHRLNQYVQRFMKALQRGGYQAMICPPHALPAMPHGRAIYLIPAASYSFLPNLLGVPAGVVATTRVRAGEESDRAAGRDRIEHLARGLEMSSTGLPVGVQVAAGHWREDIVLAVMSVLEKAFRSAGDYPDRPPIS